MSVLAQEIKTLLSFQARSIVWEWMALAYLLICNKQADTADHSLKTNLKKISCLVPKNCISDLTYGYPVQINTVRPKAKDFIVLEIS